MSRSTLRATALAALAICLQAPDARAQGAAAAGQWAHYTGGSCVQAYQRIAQLEYRDNSDSLRVDYPRVSHPASAVDAARRCVAHLDVASVPARDLVSLAKAYLAAGDDAAAKRAIDRRLAGEASAPVAVRATTLVDVVGAYIRAEPPRVAEARAHLARLDALTGPAAVIARLEAHAMLMTHHTRALEDSAAVREAETVLALAKQLDAHDRIEFSWASRNAYRTLVARAADTGGAAAARPLLARARADIGNIPIEAQVLTRLDSMYALPGREAPALTWDRLLNAPADARLPAAGRPTLIIFATARGLVPMLRRIEAQFGTRLQVVSAARTLGYFRGDGPFPPAVELDSLTRYLRDELRAPGVVALSAPGSGKRPDGRVARELSANEKAYHVAFGTTLAVVDGAGVIRYVSDGIDEPRLVRWLERVTGK